MDHPRRILRMLLRKGALTSWQIDRLKKGDPSGFFFGESKVLFHLAEGTFARVYRGEHIPTKGPVAIKVLRQRFAVDIPRPSTDSTRRPRRGSGCAIPTSSRSSTLASTKIDIS